MTSADENRETSRDSGNRLLFPGGGGYCFEGTLTGEAGRAVFIQERSALHAMFIAESEKTKRLGLVLAAGLLALACIIPIFAPAGREMVSYWISIGLFVFSAGAMGFTKIYLRTNEQELTLSSTRGPPA